MPIPLFHPVSGGFGFWILWNLPPEPRRKSSLIRPPVMLVWASCLIPVIVGICIRLPIAFIVGRDIRLFGGCPMTAHEHR